MLSESCGSSLFLSLPDDVFSVLSYSFSPRDVCCLSLCCKSINKALVASEKIWFTQCEKLGLVNSQDLFEWRKGVSSSKSLCRFLFNVKPLTGIWVHQNPELGNVVYVMPGFLSVVGCRILPQELGPLGLEDGALLWAPVFEIMADLDGSLVFFLHGQEKDGDYMYPGSVKLIDRASNVLLLEVEPRTESHEGKLLDGPSLLHFHSDQESFRGIRRADGDSSLSRSQLVVGSSDSLVPFSRLGYEDRRNLLELVLAEVGMKVPDLARGPLFPRVIEAGGSFKNDLSLLSERRLLLLRMHKQGRTRGFANWQVTPTAYSDSTELVSGKLEKSLDGPNGSLSENNVHFRNSSNRSVAGHFKDSLKEILGRSKRLISRDGTSSTEIKHAHPDEFLSSSTKIGLRLHALTTEFSTYRAWPDMCDNNQHVLYKLPTRIPTIGHEYAGLWGGTFGWPPGSPNKDEALFFLLLSYEESEGQELLTATKILEGTDYAQHPNGSPMFIVNINKFSSDTFPRDKYSPNLDVKCAYNGSGIANGYGFRYPGSKPGSLFVMEDGFLAFVWKESRDVFTLQRINLEELLRKGERVPCLPPILNFAYLSRCYTNIFAIFHTNSADSP